MPPQPTKTLSPAELSKLEHAFAAEPGSEAYKPLAEAYLGMGRFMEAMVVCKKGVKAHPTLTDPRLLLARVYAEQGKDRKALEELTGALGVNPADKVALRMSGSLQLKVGEVEPGKASLLRAYQADPSDSETRAELEKWKIEPPAVAAPPAAAAPNGNGADQWALKATEQVPIPDAAKAQLSQGGTAAQAAPQRPAAPTRTSGPRRRRPEVEESISELSEISEPSVRVHRGKNSSRRASFLLMLVGVPLVLGGYYAYGRWKAIRTHETNKALKAATEQLKHDSYDSYKKACEAADRVLELDPTSTDAHSYLAYAYTIRWGEHGGGDDARKAAEEHLAAARGSEKPVSQLFAADALFKTYSGKGAEALQSLEQTVKAFNAKGQKSSLMYLTLGIIQMNAGDLERSRESLDTAQSLAPDDPRVYSALGTLLRRRGQDQEAWKNLDFALRYEREHPESTLGKSLLILEQENPGYVVAARMLKKLIESEPPPSPRQLATAHLARALLVSRLSSDLPLYTKPETQRELSEGAAVSMDKEKNKAEVLKSEEAGFSLDRNNPELYLIKGKRLFWENNFDGAAAELRKAIELDGSRAHYHVELARVLMKKEGGAKEAEEALNKALSMNPNSPKLVAMLGHSLYKQNRLDDALKAYERAVQGSGTRNPEARLAMGRIYRDRKDFPNAITAFEKAALEYVGQSYQVAQSHDEMGLTYEAKGDKAKALEAYEKSLNSDIDYEGVYCHYAKLISADPKSKSKARSVAQEYLKRAPRGDCAAEMTKLAH